MALSANSIIHYTSEIGNLLNIIRSNGLRFSYCLETVKTRGSQNFSGAIAMVSFCDIPLSDYKKHFYNKKSTGDLGYYGDYGIGLSKKWARANGLNPVFYVDSKSHVSTSLRKDFEQFMRNNGSINVLTPHQIFLYSKNYEGELYRKTILKKKDYRFYDEREWRIVPDSKQLDNNPVVLEELVYRSNATRYQETIQNNLIKFSLEDISYIIVKNDEEKLLVYKQLNDSFGFKGDIIDLTAITILTSEQIVGDF
jgi:hypothetical protein